MSTLKLNGITKAMFAGLLLAGRRNMLHNWDFRNPVNQRGSLSAYQTNGYTIDRWRTWSSTYTVALVNSGSDGYLTLSETAGGAWGQFIPEDTVKATVGKIVTVSALLSDGTIIQKSGTFPTANSTGLFCPFPDATIGNLILWRGAGGTSDVTVQFALNAGKSISVKAVKLELGTVSTLAYDTSDYGEELRKCRRFYRTGTATAVAYSTSILIAHAQFDTMRIFPTVSIYSWLGTVKKVSTWANVSTDVGTNAVASVYNDEAIISVLDSSAPYTVGANYVFRYTASADL